MSTKEEKRKEKQQGEDKIGVVGIIGIILCILLIPILVINVTMIVKGLINPSKVAPTGGGRTSRADRRGTDGKAQTEDLIRHPPRGGSADATCPPCGTRKNLRASANPRFFRPLR